MRTPEVIEAIKLLLKDADDSIALRSILEGTWRYGVTRGALATGQREFELDH